MYRYSVRPSVRPSVYPSILLSRPSVASMLQRRAAGLLQLGRLLLISIESRGTRLNTDLFAMVPMPSEGVLNVMGAGVVHHRSMS